MEQLNEIDYKKLSATFRMERVCTNYYAGLLQFAFFIMNSFRLFTCGISTVPSYARLIDVPF